MLNALYDLLRAGLGVSLVVAGVSFLIARGADRVHRSLGALFASVGALFTISAFSPWLVLPFDLDDALVVGLIYVLSTSLISLTLFLFGNEKRKGSARRLNVIGAIVSAALVAVPFLDYAFGWGPVVTSVEDGRSLGPVHAVASALIYVWPILVSVLSFTLARWQPADVSARYPDTRIMLGGLATVTLVLVAVLTSVIVESRALYRVAHVALELFMLTWYLYVVRRPHSFLHMRQQIGGEHSRRFTLSDTESALMERRLRELAGRREIINDDGLDLRSLARRVGVPAYRLSYYFSKKLNTTFPVWRNSLRVDYVRKIMAERPDLSILEIAVEAGYNSKAAFNTQFSRLVGMRPSEYRRSLSRSSRRTDS